MADSSDGAAPGSTRQCLDAPAVTVHGLEQALAAVRAAPAGAGLVLLSAEGAGAYAGAGWFAALAGAAAAARPELRVTPVLDCAVSPGAVLAALRAGLGTIVFSGDAEVAAVLHGAAGACGALILAARPPSLDLAGFRPGDPDWCRRLRAQICPTEG